MNFDEDAAEVKYASRDFNQYIIHKTYPAHAEKAYKHAYGLRKRSQSFKADCGRLYYIGRENVKVVPFEVYGT